LILEPFSGSGSPDVDVLLSGMGLRAASGTIASAVLEMGSRAWTSLTEAKPRVKAADRMAVMSVLATHAQLRLSCVFCGVVPVRLVARRVNARSEAMVCRVWSGECGMS
jgi:hypothetical protein